MNAVKYTKIIATLGPASANAESIRTLIRAGSDCFRLNFSHGSGVTMDPLVDLVRQVSREEGVYIPILADIQGPKLRVGRLPEEGVSLKDGTGFILTTREIMGSADEVHSPYEYLTRDLKTGARVLLADGTIELKVERVEKQDVHCRVVHGGRLFSNKGINLPGTHVSVDTLTEKDRKDLEYVAGADIDLVAISFVRRARDIQQAREILQNHKIPITAKLERPEAIDNLNEILQAADGVMIARGDLGVEVDFEKVPFIQKQILERAAVRGKWAIVATEMLRSMVHHPRPTRAEVTDVANAVLDGADAVMLSEETATGDHPPLVIDAMMRIIRQADSMDQGVHSTFDADIMSFAAGAAGAAVSAAVRLEAKAIIALAGSNVTALLLSKWRPRMPILALSSGDSTLRRLNVLRGVVPVPIRSKSGMEEQIRMADELLVQEGWARVGDTVVVVGAIPLGEGRETNSIRFHRIRPREAW